MFKSHAKFDADSLLYSLSHFKCNSHTVHMLTQRSLLPPLTSTVKVSTFMHTHSSALPLAARLHQCSTNCSCYINNGWAFSGQTSYVLPNSLCIQILKYVHILFFTQLVYSTVIPLSLTNTYWGLFGFRTFRVALFSGCMYQDVFNQSPTSGLSSASSLKFCLCLTNSFAPTMLSLFWSISKETFVAVNLLGQRDHAFHNLKDVDELLPQRLD